MTVRIVFTGGSVYNSSVRCVGKVQFISDDVFL